MKTTVLTLLAAAATGPALAQETREMDAHVHGISTAEIAVEHGMVEIDLYSPGMDIVGFEYAAQSAEEKDAVTAAIRQFLTPEEIVTLPDAAGCRLVEVLAHLHGAGHGHEEPHGEDHDHDHAEEAGEDDHDHSGAGGAEHSEFHITYGFACDDEDALTTIGFPFFERFDRAEEIEVQYVTEAGAGTAGLTPGAAELTLE